MHSIRRVVTGHDARGTAIFASDEQLPALRLTSMPAAASFPLWGSDSPVRLSADGKEPDWETWFPPAGGFRFVVVSLPPDFARQEADVDMEATVEELSALFPGAADAMDPEHPGMHRTDSIDLVYIISGRVLLELDDGQTRELQAGDTLVQNGTRHAWRNPYDEPCVFVSIGIGVEADRSRTS